MPGAAASSQSSSGFLYIMMGLFIVGAYFLVIRPNQKRRREIEATQASLAPGSRVLTIGGLYGVVTVVGDDTVTLEVAPGVTNQYARAAVSKVISPPAKPEDPGVSMDKAIETD